MSLRRDAVGVITLHESCRREPHPDASPEAIAAQTAAYLARGGRITELPAGAMSSTHVGYKNAVRGSTNDLRIKKIRTEDYS